ncbi:MAG: chloramphenicol-sensitive protein RarD [Thermoleophilaceae bacterium]|jgi:chloramphenicol-sensitive protein RarD|nr:chloramphenicol-sensitive protein RarD [Thermoleophilaceae bacterium]
MDDVRHSAAAPEERAGILYGFAAYLLWGSFPLFFLLLHRAGPVEILAHRIVWSLVAVAVVLGVVRNLSGLVAVVRDRRRMLLMVAAALLIGLNWGVFIYAVNSDHVIEGSLGYFITPLVSAAFGVMVFRERLRPRQLAALGLGFCAVLVLTLDYGRLPWVALTLALSFGTYGLVKKLAGVGAAESLALETLILLVPAIAYLVVLEATGGGTFAHSSPDLALLLIASGPVTAVPLLLFGAAVTRTRLTVMGMLQYVTPVLQFLVGLLVQGEAMPTSRWVGFALVWFALLVLSLDGLHNARRGRMLEPALERV